MHYPEIFKDCKTEAVLTCSNDLCFEHSKNKKNVIFFQQKLVIIYSCKNRCTCIFHRRVCVVLQTGNHQY